MIAQPNNQGWKKWEIIHPLINQSLLECNFDTPTDIQAYVLSCYKHYNDFLVASQTGSGKTLSFGIPIMSEILFDKEDEKDKKPQNYIKCLILAPTRELVLQIENHLNQINKHSKNLIRVGSIVGGISKEKQRRILSYIPDILIATPGRLWDMIENYEHDCLKRLNQIKYFVIDEADRMVELGHFKELDNIIDQIYSRGEVSKNKEDLKKIEEFIQQKQTIKNGLISKVNVKKFEDLGEDQIISIKGDDAKKLLQKFTQNNEDQVQSEQNTQDQDDQQEESANQELDEEEVEEKLDEEEENLDENEEEENMVEGEENIEEEENIDEKEENLGEGEENTDEKEENLDEKEEENLDEKEEENLDEEEEEIDTNDILRKKIRNKKNSKMKVFLVSATLTKQFAGNKHKIKEISKKEKKKQKKINKKKTREEKKEEYENKLIPKMQALMIRIKFSGKPKIVDLTSTVLIPKNLKEFKTVCIEEDKPIYLYDYIKKRCGESFIIFNNSISYSKKILHLLTILGFKCLGLHSEMQQRQRLKKLDQFKSKQYQILVCTDIAARGLDIPTVQNVINYQIPLDIDTFIHRSGRTARIGKVGTCYSLVGPKDGQRYQKLITQLQKDQGVQNIEMTHTEREKIKSLINSGLELEKSQFDLKKKQMEKAWFKKNAKMAEIEVDKEVEVELKQIENEIQQKKKIQIKDNQNFQKVKKGVINISNKRRNNIFLDPTEIQKYAQQ
ncbi:hypothetical protein IMG5_042580, partial [Ichthyophthirius multifiliis]